MQFDVLMDEDALAQVYLKFKFNRIHSVKIVHHATPMVSQESPLEK